MRHARGHKGHLSAQIKSTCHDLAMRTLPSLIFRISSGVHMSYGRPALMSSASAICAHQSEQTTGWLSARPTMRSRNDMKLAITRLSAASSY
eukprot:2956325-Prymnesium_polylepis.1